MIIEELISGKKTELWDAVFEHSPIGIAFISSDGKWLKVNKRLAHMLEFSSEELVDKYLKDITHPDDIQADQKMLNKVVAERIDGYEIIKKFLTKTGRVIWLKCTTWPVKENGGELKYLISHFESIITNSSSKLNKSKDDKVQIRPTLSIGEFILDNWKSFLSLMGFVVTGMITVGVAFWVMISKTDYMMEELKSQREIIITILKDKLDDDSTSNEIEG